MSHDLLIVCTYTAGTPYEQEARALEASASRFGYRVRAIDVSDQGDWWRNVGIKPTFVLEALLSHDGPLLFLDADCLILQPLDEMLALLRRGDVAVKHRPGNCLSALFNAAVLLVNRTPATLELVETWAERGREFAHLHRFSEQGAFAEGVLNAQPTLRLVALPERFHMFPLKPSGGPPAGCVILHNKTSNRVRTTALPTTAPPPIVSRYGEIHLVSLGPQVPAAPGGLPMTGVLAANQDFSEYASRFGLTKIWFFGAPIGEHDRAAIETYKLAALKSLFERLPAGARILLANYDVVFVRDPQPFVTALDHADLALVWDRLSPGGLPRTEVVGLKNSPALRAELLPMIARAQTEMLAATHPATTQRFARFLREAAASIPIAELPGATIAELRDASRQTIALSMRGEINAIPGEAACTTLPIHAPSAHSQQVSS